ncbi:cyclophilin-like fold protein [Peribacillus simplex]|uniref:Cyclophilin-like fold protein n=2 Tax=Peribacillus TaxID=2675229 RepID=A0AA90T7G8_9BACI|nr:MULTISPECIES: cyclophilin-like fold protein [Peribacillus]MDP1419680.1 cyclophilin-like fold protein [Peribacillus simplex]MDP1452667.1 cyclophilin-like fold protein [Peribacillus frigoritolerans]
MESLINIKEAPSGFDPTIGDFTYYAPWGNLAFFIRTLDIQIGLLN